MKSLIFLSSIFLYVNAAHADYYQAPTDTYNRDPSRTYNQDSTRTYQDPSRTYQDPSRTYHQDPARAYNQDPARTYNRAPSDAYNRDPSRSYNQAPSRSYNETKYANTETVVKVTTDPQLGKILTDTQGRTLYMYTADNNNVSNCYDQCAVEWPPYVVSSGTPPTSPDLKGTLNVTKRKDNTFQVTYNGMPLYYYVKDTKPGDTNGQDVDKKWYVINPDSGPNKTAKKS